MLSIKIKKSSDEAISWQKKDLYSRKISGKIHLDNTQKLGCQIFLVIFTYGQAQTESIAICPCYNKGFTKFVAEGDSVIKEENTFSATFIKPDGKSRQSFILPLCN